VSRFLLTEGHDIDDILQEAFVRAYEAEKKKSIAEPKAFLFRVARNLLLSELDKKSHKVTDYLEDFELSEIEPTGCPLEDDVAAQQRLGMFCEVVAGLPAQCRRVFVMKRVYGFSQKEIAAELGISESTVEKHLIKGMRMCAQSLEERYDYFFEYQEFSSKNLGRKYGQTLVKRES